MKCNDTHLYYAYFFSSGVKKGRLYLQGQMDYIDGLLTDMRYEYARAYTQGIVFGLVTEHYRNQFPPGDTCIYDQAMEEYKGFPRVIMKKCVDILKQSAFNAHKKEYLYEGLGFAISIITYGNLTQEEQQQMLTNISADFHDAYRSGYTRGIEFRYNPHKYSTYLQALLEDKPSV